MSCRTAYRIFPVRVCICSSCAVHGQLQSKSLAKPSTRIQRIFLRHHFQSWEFTVRFHNSASRFGQCRSTLKPKQVFDANAVARFVGAALLCAELLAWESGEAVRRGSSTQGCFGPIVNDASFRIFIREQSSVNAPELLIVPSRCSRFCSCRSIREPQRSTAIGIRRSHQISIGSEDWFGTRSGVQILPPRPLFSMAYRPEWSTIGCVPQGSLVSIAHLHRVLVESMDAVTATRSSTAR